ncbi:MAG: sulfotransferase, partial [Planctomycetota bacterium]
MPAAPPSPETAPAAATGGKGDRQGYGVDPVHAYGLLTPRFWHGMRPASFLRLLAAGGFAVSPRGAATCGTILGVGAFHAVGALAQSVLCGHKLDRVRHARPPLFVLGHWRSGTTLLHELLIRDDRHTYPTTYECFAPHHFLVTEEWVTPLIRWLLPKKRPMDNVATGWERPQEDEFALCSLGLPTPYRTWAFPRRGPVDADW